MYASIQLWNESRLNCLSQKKIEQLQTLREREEFNDSSQIKELLSSLFPQPNLKPDHFDKAFNDDILALEVKCKNHEWGCKWESDYKYFQVR